MSFSIGLGGKAMYYTLFTEIRDKPIMRKYALEVFRLVCLELVGREADKPERERGNTSFADVLEDTEIITEVIADYSDDTERDRQVVMEYGVETAVELFSERTGESLEILVAESGNRVGDRDKILSYHIMKQLMESIIHSEIWGNVVRHLLQFLENDEYTEIYFVYAPEFIRLRESERRFIVYDRELSFIGSDEESDDSEGGRG
jgi:hypothetical protein